MIVLTIGTLQFTIVKETQVPCIQYLITLKDWSKSYIIEI